jgi:hypothetical protein
MQGLVPATTHFIIGPPYQAMLHTAAKQASGKKGSKDLFLSVVIAQHVFFRL